MNNINNPTRILIHKSYSQNFPNHWILNHLYPDLRLLTRIEKMEFYRIHDLLVIELENYETIQRHEYSTWISNSKEALEEFLTYFTLKYTK